MPPLHRLRLIACKNPARLQTPRVEGIMKKIDLAETRMLDFINGTSSEVEASPIPAPKSPGRRGIRWSTTSSGRVRWTQDDAVMIHIADDVEGLAVTRRNATIPEEIRLSKARKARAKLSNKLNRLKNGLSGIFNVRRSAMFPEPEIVESGFSEVVYEERERSSIERSPPHDDSSGVIHDLQEDQDDQLISGNAGVNDDAECERLLSQWSSSSEDIARVDSATARFFRRASSTFGLKKLKKRLSRARD